MKATATATKSATAKTAKALTSAKVELLAVTVHELPKGEATPRKAATATAATTAAAILLQPFFPVLVIDGPLLRVGQYLVGCGNFPKLCFRSLVSRILVWMVSLGKLLVRPLDDTFEQPQQEKNKATTSPQGVKDSAVTMSVSKIRRKCDWPSEPSAWVEPSQVWHQ